MPSDEDSHQENLRRWAASGLACYTVEGWAGQRDWGMKAGLSTPEGVSVVLSASLSHRRSDGSSLEVVSHRQDDEQFGELQARAARNVISKALRDTPLGGPGQQAAIDQEISRLENAARNDQLDWEGTVIALDHRPTIFRVTRFGDYWAAVGRGPDVDLTLAGHGMALPGSLVRLGDDPEPLPFRPPSPERAGPRDHRFPDDGLGPVVMADVADKARVDLVYRAGSELTGTVAGAPVQLIVKTPAHDATATGNFAGTAIDAEWHLGDNSTTHPDVPASLTGSWAGQPVTMSAVFHLDDDYVIDHATISGDLAGQVIAGRLHAADGGIGGSSGTVHLDGSFAGCDLSLFATVACGYKALIRGQVCGTPVRLDARVSPGPTPSARIRGSYQGPSAVLAVIVVTLLHFL